MIYLVLALGIVLDSVVLYVALLMLEKKYELGVTSGSNIISSKIVWAVMAVNAVIVAIYTLYRFNDDGIWRYMLFVLATAFMGILAVTDGKKKVIPNAVVLAALGVFVVIITTGILTDSEEGIRQLGISLAGGIFAGLAFLICYVISRKAIGGGDIKMATVLGLYVGAQYILMDLFAGIVCCAIYSIVMIIRKKMTVKDGVALAPFLYLGTLLVLLY